VNKSGPKPKIISTNWTPELAYVVGIFASDGNLGKDGMYLDVTSKDKEILKIVLGILGMTHIKIGEKFSGRGDKAYRIQFKRVLFHKWLMSIGLAPNKSKTIGKLKVPKMYFFDFLRGCFDGDGSSYSYWDPRWRSSFMFYLSFASASTDFLEWLNKRIKVGAGISGKITKGTRGYQLRFAKSGSRVLIKKMYHTKNIPHLKRKFAKIQRTLKIDDEHK